MLVCVQRDALTAGMRADNRFPVLGASSTCMGV